MNCQEQSFYEFGLLHAKLLKTKKMLTLARRIVISYTAQSDTLADSLDTREIGAGVSNSRVTAAKVAFAEAVSAPLATPADQAMVGEILTLIEELEREESELQGALKMREDLVIDEYRKMLRGDSS